MMRPNRSHRSICEKPTDRAEAARLVRDAIEGKGRPDLVRRLDSLRDSACRAGMRKAQLAIAVHGEDALAWAESRVARLLALTPSVETMGKLLAAQALVAAIRLLQPLDEHRWRA